MAAAAFDNLDWVAKEKDRRKKRAAKFGTEFDESAEGLQDSIELAAAKDQLQNGAPAPRRDVKGVGGAELVRDTALHVHGLRFLSSAQVLELFKGHGVASIEWVSNDSCNLVFDSSFACKRAMLALGKVEGGADLGSDGMAVDGSSSVIPWYTGKSQAMQLQSGSVTFRQATVADRKHVLTDILTCFGKNNGTAAEVVKAAAAAAVAAGAGGGGKRARQTMGGEGGWTFEGGVGGGVSGGGIIGIRDRVGPVFNSGRDLDAPEDSESNPSVLPIPLPLPRSLPAPVPLPVPSIMAPPAVNAPLPAVTSSGIKVTAPEGMSLSESEGVGQGEGEGGEGVDLRDKLRRGSGTGNGAGAGAGKGGGKATVTEGRERGRDTVTGRERMSLSETEAEEGEAVDLRDKLRKAQVKGDLRDRLSRKSEDKEGNREGQEGRAGGLGQRGDSVGDLRELLRRGKGGGNGWGVGSASKGRVSGEGAAAGRGEEGGEREGARGPVRKFKGRGQRMFERSLANMQASTTDDI